MLTIIETIPADNAYLIPIGDIHIEDEFFTERAEKKLRGYIQWVRERPEARIFITGDVFNVATRRSKTSPFSINKRLFNQFDGDQMAYAFDIFEPVREQIIGMIDGNHEYRTRDDNNRSWLTELCAKLSTAKRNILYCEDSCLLFLKIGKTQKYKRGTTQTYSGYIHHTTGGGSTTGGKVNRVDRLKSVIAGCDFYIGAHSHLEAGAKTRIFIPDNRACKLRSIRQIQVNAGGFLDYGGYVERFQLPPTDIGSPRLRFDSLKKDIHISL